MRVLTDENIESLKIRGYLKTYTNSAGDDFKCLNNLQNYNIPPSPYMLLFGGLDTLGMRNIMRYICLNWQNVAESLNDTCLEFHEKSPSEICTFFMSGEHTHRIYFFVEIVFQYFFP